jgi:hypothetical protein
MPASNDKMNFDEETSVKLIWLSLRTIDFAELEIIEAEKLQLEVFDLFILEKKV